MSDFRADTFTAQRPVYRLVSDRVDLGGSFGYLIFDPQRAAFKLNPYLPPHQPRAVIPSLSASVIVLKVPRGVLFEDEPLTHEIKGALLLLGLRGVLFSRDYPIHQWITPEQVWQPDLRAFSVFLGVFKGNAK